ncbi:leucine-rich repeat domain-containing protein [Pseudomonas fluorescens]|uniref:leucine-rich repeat domain-containing protein n=1 Tax=Pseudomonas fluorescens TaxID=294 RepID=UPI001242DEB2|nr:leucine-rich repeat domain-containing protein [Pseudomonas fluorescens]VVP33489.1 hypothetical protein PS898_04443 [Pseudomonas fluorescens]
MKGKTPTGTSAITPPRQPAIHSDWTETPSRIDVSPLPHLRESNIAASTTATNVNVQAGPSTTPLTVTPLPPSTLAAMVTSASRLSVADFHVTLPDNLQATIDSQGVRTIKGRKFVNLPDGKTVEIASDPDTGLYRARWPTQREPGPVLVPDPGGEYWWSPSDVLTDARLESYRTQINLEGVQPYINGVYPLDGNTYIIIRKKVYRVMRDQHGAQMMHIVHQRTANDVDNHAFFQPELIAQGEPVIFDARLGWIDAGIRRGDNEVLSLPSPERRLRELFPTIEDDLVRLTIESLGVDLPRKLTQFEVGLSRLQTRLSRWQEIANATPGMPASNNAIETASQRLLSIWRRTGPLHLDANGTPLGMELNLSGLGITNLPSLDGIEFSHVTSLKLRSNNLDRNINLSAFKNVLDLDLWGNKIEGSIHQLSAMQHLTHLNLDYNPSPINPGERLVSNTLQVLSLNNCAIAGAPDFSGLPNLRRLEMTYTNLARWPASLDQLPLLERVDLRYNALSELPDALIAPAFEHLANTRLSNIVNVDGNPFSLITLERASLYRLRLLASGLSLSNPENLLSTMRWLEPLPVRLPAHSDYGSGAASALLVRVRELYPTMGNNADAFLQSMGVDAPNVLTRLEYEFEVLKTQLNAWSKGQFNIASQKILKCWRREGRMLLGAGGEHLGLKLNLTSLNLENMPSLDADFSFVASLNLKRARLHHNPDGFLGRFPNLHELDISQNQLRSVPSALAKMQHLTRLNMSDNYLGPDAAQLIQDLGPRTSLRELNLSRNRFVHTLDLSLLPALRKLNISRTQIDSWPPGLERMPALEEVNLSHNEFKDLPLFLLAPGDQDLAGFVRLYDSLDITGNPLSSDTQSSLRLLASRLQAAGITLQRPRNLLTTVNPENQELPVSFLPTRPAQPSVLTPARRVQEIFPSYNEQSINHLIQSLEPDVPGRLAALEHELNTLKSQLQDWGGNNKKPASERILSCWRREGITQSTSATPDGAFLDLTLDLSGLNVEVLPNLDADFSHVGSLLMKNEGLYSPPEGFLSRFTNLRTLDLTNSYLTELPQALRNMNHLKRLILNGNSIALTDATARILSQRTTLQVLEMNNNPLQWLPDLSQMTQLRALALSRTGLRDWPPGLEALTSMQRINLSRNNLTSIPDYLINPAQQHLAASARLTNVINVSHNQFDESARQQALIYQMRLEAAGIRLSRRNLLLTINE